jgi:hypothetical protein
MRLDRIIGLATLMLASNYTVANSVITTVLNQQDSDAASRPTHSPPEQAQGISTLKPGKMAELVVEGGTHLQLINYQGADGIKLQSIHGTFENPTRAKEHLEKEAANAARIVKRNVTKSDNGEVVGERIEIRYYSVDNRQEYPALLWTKGPAFYKVSSPSRSYVLEFEKWLNTTRPK